MIRQSLWVALLTFLALNGCVPSQLKPVEIFPEDACSNCRMAISQTRFASEIVNAKGVVYKFDDLACLKEFQAKHPEESSAAVFYTDYDTKRWLSASEVVIVATGIATPMGSGKVAVADSQRASELASQHPPQKAN